MMSEQQLAHYNRLVEQCKRDRIAFCNGLRWVHTWLINNRFDAAAGELWAAADWKDIAESQYLSPTIRVLREESDPENTGWAFRVVNGDLEITHCHVNGTWISMKENKISITPTPKRAALWVSLFDDPFKDVVPSTTECEHDK